MSNTTTARKVIHVARRFLNPLRATTSLYTLSNTVAVDIPWPMHITCSPS